MHARTSPQYRRVRAHGSALQEELQKENIGYLVAQPRFVDALLRGEFFERAGVAMWIPISEEADANLREEFGRVGIPVRANYSSEEVGLVGSECSMFPGNYHVPLTMLSSKLKV
jgi:hypothetical protein